MYLGHSRPSLLLTRNDGPQSWASLLGRRRRARFNQRSSGPLGTHRSDRSCGGPTTWLAAAWPECQTLANLSEIAGAVAISSPSRQLQEPRAPTLRCGSQESAMRSARHDGCALRTRRVAGTFGEGTHDELPRYSP